MRDIPSLTGLRGVAALWVMAFHIGKVAGDAHAPWAAHMGLLGFGWTGVDLFFVLSGFILMWVHGADFTRPTTTALRRFAAGRIARVYPLSLAVLLLIALLAWGDPGFVAWYKAQNSDNFSIQAFVRTSFLSTRWITGGGGDWNEPTWSLSAEVVGYTAFPVLAWRLTRCSPKVAAAVGVLALAVLAVFEVLTGLAGTNPIDQIPALMRMGCGFIAGMAICRVREAMGDRAPAWAGAGALGAVLAIGLACQVKSGVLLAPAGFALLIFSLSFRRGALSELLSSKTALILGRISFPLYLVHLMPLLWLASHVSIGGLKSREHGGVDRGLCRILPDYRLAAACVPRAAAAPLGPARVSPHPPGPRPRPGGVIPSAPCSPRPFRVSAPLPWRAVFRGPSKDLEHDVRGAASDKIHRPGRTSAGQNAAFRNGRRTPWHRTALREREQAADGIIDPFEPMGPALHDALQGIVPRLSRLSHLSHHSIESERGGLKRRADIVRDARRKTFELLRAAGRRLCVPQQGEVGPECEAGGDCHADHVQNGRQAASSRQGGAGFHGCQATLLPVQRDQVGELIINHTACRGDGIRCHLPTRATRVARHGALANPSSNAPQAIDVRSGLAPYVGLAGKLRKGLVPPLRILGELQLGRRPCLLLQVLRAFRHVAQRHLEPEQRAPHRPQLDDARHGVLGNVVRPARYGLQTGVCEGGGADERGRRGREAEQHGQGVLMVRRRSAAPGLSRR